MHGSHLWWEPAPLSHGKRRRSHRCRRQDCLHVCICSVYKGKMRYACKYVWRDREVIKCKREKRRKKREKRGVSSQNLTLTLLMLMLLHASLWSSHLVPVLLWLRKNNARAWPNVGVLVGFVVVRLELGLRFVYLRSWRLKAVLSAHKGMINVPDWHKKNPPSPRIIYTLVHTLYY